MNKGPLIISSVLSKWMTCPKAPNASTVSSLLATTFRKRPPLVSDHCVNNHFVSQSNIVSKTLLYAMTATNVFSDRDNVLGKNWAYSFFFFMLSDRPRRLLENQLISKYKYHTALVIKTMMHKMYKTRCKTKSSAVYLTDAS